MEGLIHEGAYFRNFTVYRRGFLPILAQKTRMFSEDLKRTILASLRVTTSKFSSRPALGIGTSFGSLRVAAPVG